MAVCRGSDTPHIPHLLCHSCPHTLNAPAPCSPALPCAAAYGQIRSRHAALEMQAHPGVSDCEYATRVSVRRPLQLHVG